MEVLRDINKMDSLNNIPESFELMRSWHKESFDEPSLFKAKRETYRLMQYSSFETIDFYRIEKREDSYYAILKEFDTFDYDLSFFKEKEISKEIWEKIIDNLEENNFWITSRSSCKNVQFLEGTYFLIEGYKPVKDKCTLKNYHSISCTGQVNSTLSSMCNIFMILMKEETNGKNEK